eukprot:7919367-Pyramimonas_sp.AAC.1
MRWLDKCPCRALPDLGIAGVGIQVAEDTENAGHLQLVLAAEHDNTHPVMHTRSAQEYISGSEYTSPALKVMGTRTFTHQGKSLHTLGKWGSVLRLRFTERFTERLRFTEPRVRQVQQTAAQSGTADNGAVRYSRLWRSQVQRTAAQSGTADNGAVRYNRQRRSQGGREHIPDVRANHRGEESILCALYFTVPVAREVGVVALHARQVLATGISPLSTRDRSPLQEYAPSPVPR